MTASNGKPESGSRSGLASSIKEAVGGAVALGMAATSITRPQFIKHATVANLYEIEAAKIALERGRRDDVKQFAQAMLADHEKLGRELKSFIGETNSPQMPPESLDTIHRTLIDDLRGAAHDDFDRRYVAQQKIAHTEAMTLFRTYHTTARDDGLRSLVGLALPVLEAHMQMLEQLDAAVSES